VEALEVARKLNHRSAKIAYSLGIALERLPDPEAAMIAYQSAVALAPGDARAWLTAGIFEDRQGNLEQARSDLQRAYDLVPELAFTALTRVLSELGDHDAAAAIACDVLAADPSAENYLRVLKALARTANQKAELSYATDAGAIYPEDLGIQLQLGLALVRSGMATEGSQALFKAAALANGADELVQVGSAYRWAARILSASEDFDQEQDHHWRSFLESGRAAATRAIASDPNQRASHWLLGECLHRLELYAEAELEFALAASLPSLARDDDKSRSTLLERVKASPTDIAAWSALGAEAFRVRDAGLVLDLAEQFVEIDSVSPDVFDAAIADMLRLAPRRSMLFMRKLLDRHPANAVRLYSFAVAARFCGERDDAETAMREAVALENRNPIYWYFRGLVSEERQDDSLAEQCYERALEIKWLPKAKRRLENLQARRRAGGAETSTSAASA
jgi:Flp pilus assembly protein TadD